LRLEQFQQTESHTNALKAPPSNKPMQPTPLCGHKIVAFLKVGFGPIAFPIDNGGAADGQGVGRQLINASLC